MFSFCFMFWGQGLIMKVDLKPEEIFLPLPLLQDTASKNKSQRKKCFLKDLFSFMFECFVHAYHMCATTQGGQTKALDLLKFELQMVMSHLVGTKN